MRRRLQHITFRCNRRRIRAKRNPGLANLLLQVVFAHQEINCADARTIFEHEIHDGLDRIFAAHLRNFTESLATQGLQLLTAETGQQKPIRRPCKHVQIFPVVRVGANGIRNLPACIRILEPFGRIKDFKPYKLATPIQLDVRFKNYRPSELLAYLSIVERTDAHSIRFTGKDMIEVSKFLEFITTYEPSLEP